jgi:formate-dependent nitrite reductase membrane component NrfD
MAAYERRWETRRGGGRSVSDDSRNSYYGIPAIHKPHWKWLITCYFFAGGISGASYAIASIAQLFRGAETERIARAGRYLSFATLLVSPPLLILDLGRPERFHHMLRIFKLRSPMSVGSWILSVFGGFCGLSALIQAARDGLLGRSNLLARALRALPARAIGTVGMPFGFALSGYTGVLLAATAVPLWTKNYLLMGPLFLASSVSNATAAIALILSAAKGTGEGALRRLERLDTIALLAELTLLLVHRARLGRVIARPMVEGRVGRVYRFGVLGMGLGAPLALRGGRLLSRRNPSRLVVGLSSTLVLSGGLLFRYVIVTAGRDSADDPHATFEFASVRTPPSAHPPV